MLFEVDSRLRDGVAFNVQLQIVFEYNEKKGFKVDFFFAPSQHLRLKKN